MWKRKRITLFPYFTSWNSPSVLTVMTDKSLGTWFFVIFCKFFWLTVTLSFLGVQLLLECWVPSISFIGISKSFLSHSETTLKLLFTLLDSAVTWLDFFKLEKKTKNICMVFKRIIKKEKDKQFFKLHDTLH